MLAGHDTVSKVVSKLDALSHGMTSGNPRFAADVCVLGARETARDPGQAAGRDHGDVRGNYGTGRRGLYVWRYR